MFKKILLNRPSQYLYVLKQYGKERDGHDAHHSGEHHAFDSKIDIGFILLGEDHGAHGDRHGGFDHDSRRQQASGSDDEFHENKTDERRYDQFQQADDIGMLRCKQLPHINLSQMRPDDDHGKRTGNIADGFQRGPDDIRQRDLSNKKNQSNDKAKKAGIQARFYGFFYHFLPVVFFRRSNHGNADGEHKHVVHRITDGAIKQRFWTKQPAQHRKSDKPGVAEYQHKCEYAGLGIGQLGQLARDLGQDHRRSNDAGEDDKCVFAIIENLHGKFHLHGHDDQARKGHIGNQRRHAFRMLFGKYAYFLQQKSRKHDNEYLCQRDDDIRCCHKSLLYD